MISSAIAKIHQFKKLDLSAFSINLLVGWIKNIIFPLLGTLLFLIFWQAGAAKVETSLGEFPGPIVVFEQWQGLIA
ncbi:MAG: hypothetical protein ACI9DO_003047, partial [Reinekea sp.]